MTAAQIKTFPSLPPKCQVCRKSHDPGTPCAWSPYMNFEEARLYSKIPRRTLQQLLATGEIPSRKFPGKIVIAKAALDRYMAEEPQLPESILRRTAR